MSWMAAKPPEKRNYFIDRMLPWPGAPVAAEA
jgi:hypothetical protein